MPILYLKYYEYLKVHKVKLEEKTKKMDQDYRNRAMGLQNEIAAYQRNVSNMTLGQVKAVEEDLGKKQQNLQMYQQIAKSATDGRRSVRFRKNCTSALPFF